MQATPDLARFVLGALYTGCRATELLRMKVAHVECDGPGVYVTPVKSYTPRFVFCLRRGCNFFAASPLGGIPTRHFFCVKTEGSGSTTTSTLLNEQ